MNFGGFSRTELTQDDSCGVYHPTKGNFDLVISGLPLVEIFLIDLISPKLLIGTKL